VRRSSPSGQSRSFSTEPQSDTAPQQSGEDTEDVDDFVRETVTRQDLLIVELVGLTAAAAAIRGVRGSSERHGVPVALALLKLPTGARCSAVLEAPQ
jgi:hypothetical protein